MTNENDPIRRGSVSAAVDALGYVCDGCGHLCGNPLKDLAMIVRSGGLSCCPERQMVPLSKRLAALPAVTVGLPTVDELAQIIRTVDGENRLGAGELAERILAALEPQPAPDLTNPNVVHVNMLRGTIAKPTVEQIIHLYGVEAITPNQVDGSFGGDPVVKDALAAGDDMLAMMLALIDSAMGCSDEAPTIVKITPRELASWADAVQKYEEARFPMKIGETE